MSFLLKKIDLLGQKTDLSLAGAPVAQVSKLSQNKDTEIVIESSSPKVEIIFKDIVVDLDETCRVAENNQTSSIDQDASSKSSTDTVTNDETTSPKTESSATDGHDLTLFHVSCTCADCLKYREIIIQLFLEDLEYNALWERLQLLIRKFYDLVPDNKSNVMEQKYKAIMTKSTSKWSSDGLIDGKKNIQLSLGSNLPYSNEMTFILVFSMLYARDPHQLFELLCIQMRCIAIAYSQGLKSIIKNSSDLSQQPIYNPIDLLNFILDGYDKMCNASKELTPLLFELQRGHLQKFSLTWNLLNKRVYQRWVYLEVQDLIPECILSLKELLDTEKYKAMVYRFIKFDDEMTLTTQMWRDVWSLIHDYHLNSEDIERRKRIISVHSVFKNVKNTKFKLYDRDFENPNHNLFEWISENDRNTVWNFTVYFLRSNWIDCTEQRLNATIANVQCLKCNFALASHYVDCTCRTCLIAGGPCFTKLKENTKQMCCTKCSFFEKLDRDYLDYVTKIISNKSEEANKKTRLVYDPNNIQTVVPNTNIDPGIEWCCNHSYHLSWAVFKHLPSRQPYNTKTFNVEHFCSFQSTPCTLNECRVATHIIAGLYPLNFSKFLIKAYQPLVDDERKDLLDIQNLYFTYLIQKLCDDNTKKINPVHAMDLLWNVDDSDYALLCDIGSAFAECYFTDSTSITVGETIKSCFLADGYDIELNLYWLECIYMAKSNDNSTMAFNAKEGDRDDFKISDIKDPKLTELKELRFQMDKLFLGKTTYKRRALLRYDSTIAPIGKTTENKMKNNINTNSNSPIVSRHQEEQEQSTSLDQPSVPVTKEKCIQKLSSKDDKSLKSTVNDNPKGGDHLAEALKLAVNQKLNLTLEAELRTLKKEHSVLKDMVRDLEQIKENEEKQIKTTDKISHQCCTEHSNLFDNQPNKMCHRGDGQCTCYYCSIFGHTECNHGRTNETRDRLRKRLHHQIHNKEISKLTTAKNTKIAHGISKKTPSTNEVKLLANATFKDGIDSQQTVPVHPNNRPDGGTPKRTLQSPILNQTQNILVGSSAQQQQKHLDCNQQSVNLSISDAGSRNSKKTFVTLLDKSIYGQKNKEVNNDSVSPSVGRQLPYCKIEDILQFIEGNSTKKDSVKKAAKKAKQKQKKKDVKKIEELEQMRDEFHSIFFKESDAKNELKTLKAMKKKDKKKIVEAENNVKKYSKTRAKFESSILELIADLKRNNSEFKFAYLPSKGLQQMKQQQQHPKSTFQNNQKLRNISINNDKDAGIVKSSDPIIKPTSTISTTNIQKQPNCEMSLDPSKRMVTIRRINVPYADPQVTVTAKGSSPDKDKLLYTFINGQLVVANPSDSNTLKINTSHLQQYQLQHQQLRQQNLVAQIENDNNTLATKNIQQKSTLNEPTAAISNTIKTDNKKTKTDLKKIENFLPTELSKVSKSDSIEKKRQTKEKLSGKKLMEQQQLQSKKQLEKATANKIVRSVPSKSAKHVDEPEKKISKRKVKAPKFEYADPQYKMNKFDVLDLEDDDYYISDVESLTDEDDSSSAVNIYLPNENKLQSVIDKKSSLKSNDNAILKSVSLLKQPQKKVKTQKNITNITNHSHSNKKNDALISKKQRKATIQQQSTTSGIQTSQIEFIGNSMAIAGKSGTKSRIENSVLQADKMTKSLQSSMQKLRLNDDTTIELVNENHNQSFKPQVNSSVSIMDQLNRGVKVEGLMLPPGITLTRVDPNILSSTHAKKESIGRICHPMPANISQEQIQPHLIMTNPIITAPINVTQNNSNGFIMVDTININKNINSQFTTTDVQNKNVIKKAKKNRKKNKNHKDNDSSVSNSNNASSSSRSNIVTLRNPLFQGNNGPMRQLKQGTRPQMPLNIDQPAAIIKNENGMFTIRNPALHQALSNSIATKNNIKQYITEKELSTAASQDNLSFFSDQTITATCNGIPAKQTVAIGSEIKTVQQQKQQQQCHLHQHQMPWTKDLSRSQFQSQQNSNDIFQMSHLNPQQTQSYSPFDSQLSQYGFNSDFIGTSSCESQPHYYSAANNDYGTYSNSFSKCGDCKKSYFGNNLHRCNSPPLGVTHDSKLYENVSQNHNSKKYDDMSFLHNLQPGQRLNSEVTIHNINESKFHRNQQQLPLTNGVEITRITGPPLQQYAATLPPVTNLAVGSQRKVSSARSGDNIGEFGDNIFAPNQTVNLNELESEERDIESFKRFNYYFEPPKNKPKINFNVKDIVLKKPTNSERSSPYFSEPTSVNSTPTLDDLFQDMNALSLSNPCDIMQQQQRQKHSQLPYHYNKNINLSGPQPLSTSSLLASPSSRSIGAIGNNNCNDDNFLQNGIIKNDLHGSLIE